MVFRNPHNPNNPIVYLDIAIGDEVAGRIIIELRADTVPKTAENFLRLCNGTAGIGSFSQKKLTYEGTLFHKVQSTFAIQGGDVTKNTGRSGESIYGRFFDDENFILPHEVGSVAMANYGRPNTNNSQFYMTAIECPHLDGTNVVFGYILRGFGVISEMEKFAGNQFIDDHRPTRAMRVYKCGQIQLGEPYGICETDNLPDKLPHFPMDWDDRPETIPFEMMVKVLEDIRESAKITYQECDPINAGRRYKKLARYLKFFVSQVPRAETEKRERLEAIARKNHDNLAVVEIKLGHWKEAIDLCNILLNVDKNNVRALYRRGKANVELKNFDEGLKDLKAAKALNPRDEMIENELQNAKAQWRLYIDKERQKYTNMFQ